MTDPFVAEIRIFAGNFAPTGWAVCNGQLIPISQNTALFSLLGTMYGGDGKSTFALPDLQGSAPMFWGQGPGLSLRDQGEQSGTNTVTLLESEIPAHTHGLFATAGLAAGRDPTNNPLARSRNGTAYQSAVNASVVGMSPQVVSVNGSSFPHNNMQPYLCLTFIIAMQGIFPPRS
jgi:microcystin-dependent protein